MADRDQKQLSDATNVNRRGLLKYGRIATSSVLGNGASLTPSPHRRAGPRPRRVGITRKFASGVGKIPDGHRWDSSRKIRFAP